MIIILSRKMASEAPRKLPSQEFILNVKVLTGMKFED